MVILTMNVRTRIFSFVMAIALLLTGIVPSMVQSESMSEASAQALRTDNIRVVVSSGGNLRTGPGTSYSARGYAYAQAVLRYAGSAKDASGKTWYKVFYTGLNGSGLSYAYIRSDCAKAVLAQPAGVIYVKKCIFYRSDNPNDTAAISGSVKSPLTGWFPYCKTSNNFGFAVLYSTYNTITDTTYKCAVSSNPCSCAGGTYEIQYFKKRNTAASGYGATEYAKGSGKWVKINKTSVYQRYWPSTRVGYAGQYTNGTKYSTDGTNGAKMYRVYNTHEGRYWYGVLVNGTYVWVRDDCCTTNIPQ